MTEEYEVLQRETVWQGFFQMDRLTIRHSSFNGGWCQPIVRERLEGLDAASVLLFDPDRDELVLVEQFRAGLVGRVDPPWCLETVSGFCDRTRQSGGPGCWTSRTTSMHWGAMRSRWVSSVRHKGTSRTAPIRVERDTCPFSAASAAQSAHFSRHSIPARS